MPTSDPSSCRVGLCWMSCSHLSPPWFSGVGVDIRRITFLITCPRQKDVDKGGKDLMVSAFIKKHYASLCVILFQRWTGNLVIRYFSTDEVTILVHIVFLCHRLAWDILCFFSLQMFLVSTWLRAKIADSNMIKHSFTITTLKQHPKKESPRQKKAEHKVSLQLVNINTMVWGTMNCDRLSSHVHKHIYEHTKSVELLVHQAILLHYTPD